MVMRTFYDQQYMQTSQHLIKFFVTEAEVKFTSFPKGNSRESIKLEFQFSKFIAYLRKYSNQTEGCCNWILRDKIDVLRYTNKTRFVKVCKLHGWKADTSLLLSCSKGDIYLLYRILNWTEIILLCVTTLLPWIWVFYHLFCSKYLYLNLPKYLP